MSQKKGCPKGPRQVLFVASAIIDGKLIQEEVFSPADVNPDNFTRDNAIELFKKSYGVAPEKISNSALYQKKSALIKQISPPFINSNEIEVLEKHEAEYRGWSGWAFDVKNRPEMVFFVPLKELSSEGKKSKIISQGVYRSAVSILAKSNEQNQS